MNVSPSAAGIAMQTMQQGSSQGTGATASTPLAALALVVAATATAPQASANGMVGSIVNTYA